ncbi:MAG: ribosome-associated translation inhibitor RaiA [Patescibacteria group bacterium]|jgi:ribosomal subunit interface protein
MKIQIYNQNFDLTDPFKEYLQMRFDALDKYQSEILDFQVKLIRDQRHQKGDVYTIEAKLSMPNTETIFVKEEDSDARSAVDKVQEKLARILVKNKNKKIGKLRKSIKKFQSLKFWKKKEY